MAATSSSCAGDNLFNSSLNDFRTLFIIYTAFDLFFYFFSISGGDLAFCLCHFITIFIYIFSCKFFLRCASYNFDKFLQCPFFLRQDTTTCFRSWYILLDIPAENCYTIVISFGWWLKHSLYFPRCGGCFLFYITLLLFYYQ